MIKLNAEKNKECFAEQTIIYDDKEMGFISSKHASVCISLLVAYVEIQFDGEDMCAKSVCGLSHKRTWKAAKLSKPENVITCALKLEDNFEWGVYRLDADNEWETFYDDETGWLCIGEINGNGSFININFISNVIATLDEKGALKALWIKPGE